MSSKTQPTVYDRLIALRNRQRTLQAESPFVIRGADVPWETNPQGIIKWYLHPAMERSCHKALIFSVQKKSIRRDRRMTTITRARKKSSSALERQRSSCAAMSAERK